VPRRIWVRQVQVSIEKFLFLPARHTHDDALPGHTRAQLHHAQQNGADRLIRRGDHSGHIRAVRDFPAQAGLLIDT